VPRIISFNRRKIERVDFQRPGFLVLEDDGPMLDCFIINISDDGACIRTDEATFPKVFLLLISANGAVRRTCTTVWQRGDIVGVRFLPQTVGPRLRQQDNASFGLTANETNLLLTPRCREDSMEVA